MEIHRKLSNRLYRFKNTSIVGWQNAVSWSCELSRNRYYFIVNWVL